MGRDEPTTTEEKTPIRAVIAQEVEFKTEQEMLDYFGITRIEVVEQDNAFIGGRALVYTKGKLNPTRVSLFVDREDGSLRSPKRAGVVESPIDRGTPWTRGDRTIMLHDTYMPNAILELIERRANAQIDARPSLAQKQQEIRAKREKEAAGAGKSTAGTDTAQPEKDANPFNPDDEPKDKKGKTKGAAKKE